MGGGGGRKAWEVRLSRGGRGGFGFTLIQGVEEEGVFIARVVAGGQAEKCGLVGLDKVMAINRRAPTSVEEAVNLIKEAGDNLVMVIGRREAGRAGRSTESKREDPTTRPQTSSRGRSRERTSATGSARTLSKSPSRQLLQQAMAGARTQKQRSSSSPRSQQPDKSPQTHVAQQPSREVEIQVTSRIPAGNYREVEIKTASTTPADTKDSLVPSRSGVIERDAGKEEQRELFSPSAAQLQELLQFAAAAAGGSSTDKTKPEGKSDPGADTQNLGPAPLRGSGNNKDKAERRSSPTPSVVTTVMIEETKETKSCSRTVSTENLSHIPGSPASKRASSSKETKTSSKETTTLTKITSKSTENLHALGSLGSPKFLRSDLEQEETKGPKSTTTSRLVAASNGLAKNLGSTQSIQSIGKCNCAPVYENKMACLRDSINELTKKTEKLGQENEKLVKENKDIKQAFSWGAKQLDEKEEKIEKLQMSVSSLSEELDAEKAKQKTTKEKDISHIQKLEEDIKSMKEQLEVEVHRRERSEENQKRLEVELEAKKVEAKQQSDKEVVRKADYEERLQKALRELRSEYEVKMRESREELARVYKVRLKEMQVKAREQKEDKKLREQREEKEELARRVASLEMASLEVKKKVDQLGDRVEDKKSQAIASEEAELKKKEALLQQMHHESLLELRTALDAKIAALEAVVVDPQQSDEDNNKEGKKGQRSCDESETNKEEKTGQWSNGKILHSSSLQEDEDDEESQMEKRISQNA